MSTNREWPHKWGFKDSEFIVNQDRSVKLTGNHYELCKDTIPGLIDFISEITQLKIDHTDLLQEVKIGKISQSHVNEEFLDDLKNIVPDEAFNFDDAVRLQNSHGQTSVNEIYKILYEQFENKIVDMVLFPTNEDHVFKVVELAKLHNVCLIPVGGRTNVSNALTVPSYERRMVVAVNMRKMNSMKWMDKENLRACFESGITGKELENILNAQGFTSGHEPDSYEFSTLGGWIATKCSGMKKNKYGNIESIVESIRIVTPEYRISEESSFPRQSSGIDYNNILFGNEGNLGIITEATIKIHPLPEKREYTSLIFPNFKMGVNFLYELSQHQTWPASIRLMDNVQFRFGHALKPKPSFFNSVKQSLEKFILFNLKKIEPKEMVVATVLMEGKNTDVKEQCKTINLLARKFGAINAGKENGKRGYMLTFAIAYIRELFSKLYILGETFETTVPWNKINEVYDAVIHEAHEQHKKFNLPGKPLICARVTQIYTTGVCIYFTYGFYFKNIDSPDKIFSQIEHAFRQVILEKGGSISHHHGVGKLRSRFMDNIISKETAKFLKKLKKSLDPKNIFGINNNLFYETYSANDNTKKRN